MHGPIDYIVVKFKDAKFDGTVLSELEKNVAKDIINVLDIAVIEKDKSGQVNSIELTNINDKTLDKIIKSKGYQAGLINEEDIDEIGKLIENGSFIAMLVIEQVWAKGLKKAILNKNGELIAEGRIHPEAAEELDKKGEN